MSAQEMTSSFNPVDMAVFFILILSAFVGVMRGFTKEVLSTGGWIASGLVTTYSYVPLRGFFRGMIGNAFFADIAAILFVFVTSLVIFTTLISALSNKVKQSHLGGLDRSLGVIYGFFRAGVLVIGLFIVSLFIWKTPSARPQVLQHAYFLSAVEKGAFALIEMAPNGLVPDSFKARLVRGELRTNEEMFKALAKPKAEGKTTEKHEDGDYAAAKRVEMERLFKTVEGAAALAAKKAQG
ncbi:MAG: hypothetical protein C0514_02190 [Candidatus Puniceispirillum sp.]|nr:hypothetical protein [Candidatus Puniceispirillum sp.]